MSKPVKITWKGVTTTYKLSIDSWVAAGGGILAANGALKTAANVAKIIPYVDAVISLWESVEADERFKRIEKELERIFYYLRDIYDRLHNLEVRLALSDNKAKRDSLDRIDGELQRINRKAREPDVSPRDLKNYCIDLAEIADRFLKSDASAATGEVLQFDLWRSAGFRTRGESQEILHDQFTTWPAVSLYAMTITLWMDLRRRALQGGVKPAVQDERARRRHADALSIRPDFKRLERIDHGRKYSLLEYASLHVSYGFHARKRGRECVLTEYVSDSMGSFDYEREAGSYTDPPNESGFCMLSDFNITEDDTPNLLPQIEELTGIALMKRLKMQLESKPLLDFGPVWPKMTRLDMYAVDGENDLQQYWATTKSDLSTPLDWQRAPNRVGMSWGSLRAVVAGTWNGLYALRSDGVLVWYRHAGQREQRPEWVGPRLVDPPVSLPHARVEHLIGSDNGSLYEVVFVPGGLVHPRTGEMTRSSRELYFRQRLADEDPPKLAKRVRLRLDWGVEHLGGKDLNEYSKMFAGGLGTFYGIDAAGVLYWHRHANTRSVEGPIPLGGGWGRYTHAFAGRDGLLFGVTPDGSMFAHAMKRWDIPPEAKNGVRRPQQIGKPVLVFGGTQWSSHKRFIPMLELPPIDLR